MYIPKAKKKREKTLPEHYVDNKKFSQEVMEYVQLANDSGEDQRPQVSDYIGDCLLKICEGLSHKQNFRGYSYRDEMVGDAVENCFKAILNYNIDTATRTGSPNAFSYFSKIAFYAFLRRIAKEKKQAEGRKSYLREGAIDSLVFMDNRLADTVAEYSASAYIAEVKTLFGDEMVDSSQKDPTALSGHPEGPEGGSMTKRRKYIRKVDSDLGDYLDD